VLEVGSDPQVPSFRNFTYLDPQMGLIRNLGVRRQDLYASIAMDVKNEQLLRNLYAGIAMDVRNEQLL